MVKQSRQRGSAPVHRQEASTADILTKLVDSADRNIEKVVLYGFVKNSQGQVAGFALVCSVSWEEEELSINSANKKAERYFEGFIQSHIDSHLLLADAVFEITFSDPEFGEPVGYGSGFVKFYGGFQN